MQPVPHAEVLQNDWLPPVAIARRAAVDEVVRRLDAPRPRAPPPWTIGIEGPAGSGTSVVARRAAREVADRLRAEAMGPPPRVLAVRVGALRGPHGLATALLQRLDEGFDGRGFCVNEILAGVLRRIRREGRPTILVLDDVGPGAPSVAPVLVAVGCPDRFLPEGESGLPPWWTLVAGTPESLRAVEGPGGGRLTFAPFVRLPPYSPEELTAIVADRANRALGRPLPTAEVEALVERTATEGGGAARAVALLKRRLLGASAFAGLGAPSAPFPDGIPIEPRVVRAIGTASGGRAARLAEVKRIEAELARSQGARPLPATTLWRRIVRLEQAGYVRREIRAGGNGGTVSLLRVLTPIDEWVTADRRTGTPRAFAPWDDDGRWSAEDRPGSLRPDPTELPRGAAPD